MVKGQAKSIECEVVKIIHQETYERGGGYNLQVVRWIIDGKRHKPSFEKRETWVDDSGNARGGKAKGFNSKDIEIVFKNMPDICQAMEMNFQLLVQSLGEDAPASTPEPTAEAVGDHKDPW